MATLRNNVFFFQVQHPDFGPAKLRAAYRALKNALSSSISEEMKDEGSKDCVIAGWYSWDSG